MRTEIVLLTPKFSAQLLDRNCINRPFSLVNLKKIKRSISRGEWKLNGEAIIIFKNGNVGDGQHRLRAVVETGISIMVLIVWDVDEQVFGTIDSGRARTPSDVLSIKGEVNTITLATAARAYLYTQITQYEFALVTSLQLEQVVELHPDIRFWTQEYCRHKKAMAFLPGAFCGFMAIASEKYGRERLMPFFQQLSTGVGLLAKSPALVLRNRLTSQTNSKGISSLIKQAFLIKSINAFLEGKEISILRQSEGEAFPKII